MTKVVRISGLFVALGRETIEREIWYQTRDMDYIISVEERMPRTDDGYWFVIKGIPAMTGVRN